jgi:hypothetical protein
MLKLTPSRLENFLLIQFPSVASELGKVFFGLTFHQQAKNGKFNTHKKILFYYLNKNSKVK